MEVVNELWPTSPERVESMQAEGPEGPIYMVNLLKFKEKAEYEDGRETNLTGHAAYQLYANAVADVLKSFGGEAIFAADVTFLALGQVEELWDEVAIARYPTRGDMLRMSMSEEWQAIALHRAAGLAGQLNIETVAQAGGIGAAIS